jgi:purine catabolism regulator
MSVSLEWLLDQPELHLRFVTGGPASAALTWAHANDLADPTPWLAGGELLLTTGSQLSRSGREQRAYVERLADAGVVGLGFGTGIRYDAIPAPIVDACSERGLPLVEVPLPTPFIAITQAVARELSEQELRSVQEALAQQRRMTRSAVRGGLAGLVVVVGRELRCEAAVLDEYGMVMASSTKQNELLELVIEQWQRLGANARKGAVGLATDHGILEFQTLRGRSAVVGWLAILQRGPHSATDRLLLNQAAGLITLLLDWPAELIAAYHALGGTLLDLLLDPSGRAASLVRHLHHFGFGRSDPVMLAVLTAPRGRARLLEVVNDRLEAMAHPHVVSTTEGGVVALLLARDAHMLVEALDRSVRDAELSTVVIGVSGSLPQAAVASGLAPAEQAAAAARLDGRTVGWFDELTLGAVVADEQVRSRVWTLTRSALDALAGDGSRDSDLLPSLEAFLHHNGSWEGAARALGVHRHTLRARMARVEELTGLSLGVADNRALILLALRSRPEAGA